MEILRVLNDCDAGRRPGPDPPEAGQCTVLVAVGGTAAWLRVPAQDAGLKH